MNGLMEMTIRAAIANSASQKSFFQGMQNHWNHHIAALERVSNQVDVKPSDSDDVGRSDGRPWPDRLYYSISAS